MTKTESKDLKKLKDEFIELLLQHESSLENEAKKEKRFKQLKKAIMELKPKLESKMKSFKTFFCDINGVSNIEDHKTLEAAKSHARDMAKESLKDDLNAQSSFFYTIEKYEDEEIVSSELGDIKTEEICIN